MSNKYIEQWKNACITKRESRRWVLNNPGGSFLWAEVICLETGGLLVHGDTIPVIFGGYWRTDELDPLRTVGSKPIGDGYILEKARIGSQGRTDFTEITEDSFRKDLEDYMREEESDCQHDPNADRKTLESYYEALDALEDYGVEEAQRVLYEDAGHDGEWVYGLGSRTTDQFHYAHAAVKRVWEIVKSELPST